MTAGPIYLQLKLAWWELANYYNLVREIHKITTIDWTINIYYNYDLTFQKKYYILIE